MCKMLYTNVILVGNEYEAKTYPAWTCGNIHTVNVDSLCACLYGAPFVSKLVKLQYLIANCRFINTATDLINSALGI